MKLSRKKLLKDPLKSRMSVVSVVLMIVLILYAASVLGLLLFVLLTSFKNPATYHAGLDLPKKLYPNIIAIFNGDKLSVNGRLNGAPHKYNLGEMFGLTLWYAIMSGFVKTLVPCITAYACARYKFKLSGIIYTVVIVVMSIPTVGNQPSEFKFVYALGLYDNIFFIWILKASFLGMYFLVFHEHFKSMPDSYVEAARIDGAGNLQIMLKIALPLAINVFLTVFLIETINFWNDYQTPLMYLKSYPTLANMMYSAVLQSSLPGLDKTPQNAAAAFVTLLPTLVLFVIFQKKLMGNLTVGGIKG